MIAAEARIASVLEDARDGFYAGSVRDEEALSLARELGYVRLIYEGVGGFMGLGKLALTDEGRAALEAIQ